MSSPLSRRNFLAASGAGVGMAAMTSASVLAVEKLTAEQRKEKLPHRSLGKIGRRISIVGFGGGSRYLLQNDLDEAEKMIHRAVELGITYFDTAHGYRKNGVCESHRRYGKFLTPNYRNQITLTTKLAARDAETAKRQLDETLKDLRTDRVEILHFHAVHSIKDVDRIVAKGGALEVFQRAKQEGITKYIGVTAHMNPDVLLDALKRIRPDCTMYPHNPVQDATIYGDWSMAPCGLSFAMLVTPYVLEQGIGRLAMKVTGQNHLVGKRGVGAEELIRYALSQNPSSAIIGMPSLKIVESNAQIAKTAADMPGGQQTSLQERLASATSPADLPYLASGYVDGTLPT